MDRGKLSAKKAQAPRGRSGWEFPVQRFGQRTIFKEDKGCRDAAVGCRVGLHEEVGNPDIRSKAFSHVWRHNMVCLGHLVHEALAQVRESTASRVPTLTVLQHAPLQIVLQHASLEIHERFGGERRTYLVSGFFSDPFGSPNLDPVFGSDPDSPDTSSRLHTDAGLT